MSEEKTNREELSQFLGRSGHTTPYVSWRILKVFRFVTPSAWHEDAVEVDMANQHRDRGHFRIHAIQAADYAIRPMDPAIMEGGPVIKFSTDDPRLTDPGLQYVPGGDGELYDPHAVTNSSN